MKKLSLMIISLLLALIPQSVLALEAFNISSYDIDMKANLDNSYSITEVLEVDFSEQRHGIIRSITLKTNGGKRAEVKSVSVPGHNFETYREGGNLNIKIGDADTFAAQKQKYTILYEYEIGYDYLDDMDELYFNLIGTQWDCFIDNVKFRIEMPSAFDSEKLNFTYGTEGSKDSEAVKYSVDGNIITGKLSTKLEPYEALTVALPLEEGYFSEAHKKTTPADIVQKYYMAILPAITALGAFFWFRKGRSKPFVQTVEFYAPEGVTPADAGFIIDNSVDPMDITSLIIYWADRGYIEIEEHTEKKLLSSKKTFTLHKLSDISADAKSYEKTMFESLFDEFGDGTRVTTEELEYKFYKVMNAVKEMVRSSWQDDPDRRVYKRINLLISFTLMLLSILTAFLGFIPAINTAFADTFGITAVLAFMSSVGAMFPVWMLIYFISRNRYREKKLGYFAGLIMLTALSLMAWALALYLSNTQNSAIPLALALAGSAALGAMASMCDGRTETGNEFYGRMLGFREFLQTAEKDRINMLVEENPHYFYSTLPYAMVLGVTDRWAKNFESIITQPPDWYRTDGYGGTFNTILFANSISNSMNSFNSVMSTPKPQSTSSSGGSIGGGFSGGGSGGGGGSSW